MTTSCLIPNCRKSTQNLDVICQECSRQTRIQLAEIPVFYIEAGAYLEPGRGGNGSSGAERTIGVNLAALGFRQAGEILPVLTAWVELVTDERDLAPYKATGTIQDRIEDAIAFLLRHAPWISSHVAAPDFVAEVQVIHNQGLSATRRFQEKQTKIKCPSPIESLDQFGNAMQTMCAKWLVIGESALDIVQCPRCKYEWTTLRLVSVAVDNPGVPVWFDAKDIAAFLQVSADYVRKLARKHGAKRLVVKGDAVYDLAEIKAIKQRKDVSA